MHGFWDDLVIMYCVKRKESDPLQLGCSTTQSSIRLRIAHTRNIVKMAFVLSVCKMWYCQVGSSISYLMAPVLLLDPFPSQHTFVEFCAIGRLHWQCDLPNRDIAMHIFHVWMCTFRRKMFDTRHTSKVNYHESRWAAQWLVEITTDQIMLPSHSNNHLHHHLFCTTIWYTMNTLWLYTKLRYSNSYGAIIRKVLQL